MRKDYLTLDNPTDDLHTTMDRSFSFERSPTSNHPRSLSPLSTSFLSPMSSPYLSPKSSKSNDILRSFSTDDRDDNSNSYLYPSAICKAGTGGGGLFATASIHNSHSYSALSYIHSPGTKNHSHGTINQSPGTINYSLGTINHSPDTINLSPGTISQSSKEMGKMCEEKSLKLSRSSSDIFYLSSSSVTGMSHGNVDSSKGLDKKGSNKGQEISTHKYGDKRLSRFNSSDDLRHLQSPLTSRQSPLISGESTSSKSLPLLSKQQPIISINNLSSTPSTSNSLNFISDISYIGNLRKKYCSMDELDNLLPLKK